MLFPGAEATLQASGPFPGEGGTKLFSLILVSGYPSLSNEGGVNPTSRTVFTVGVGGVNGIGRHGFNARLEQALLQLDTLLQAGTLVESVKREVLDERDPVHLDVVDLGPELHASRLFPPDDGTDVVLVHAHDPIAYLLPVKQSCLLVENFLDDRETLVETQGQSRFFPSLAKHLFHLPDLFSK